MIYQVFLRSFSGDGTFAALESRLDALQALGADTLWLLPVHPNGTERALGSCGSPFAVKDHMAVHSDHGTLVDFRRLVKACHARGLRVIIDWVANHTAWDHPWLSSHPNWYVKDRHGAIVHPPGTDWSDVAQLDYDVPELRAAMGQAMRFWVEDVQVDGFRLDYAEGVPADFWTSTLSELRAVKPNLILLAHGTRPWFKSVGITHVYDEEVYRALSHVFSAGGSAKGIAEAVQPMQGFSVHEQLRFATNHDQNAWDAPAPARYGGVLPAQVATAIVAFLPGVPLVYNGQEVGSTQRLDLFERIPIDWEGGDDSRVWFTRIFDVRKSQAAFTSGDFSDASVDDAFIARRSVSDAQGVRHSLWMVANVRNVPIDVTLPSGEGRKEVRTGGSMPASVQMAPFEVKIYASAGED